MAIQDDFQAMVRKLQKSPAVILNEMTEQSASLMHNALGVATESGEICTIIKNHIIYGKPLDTMRLVEEIGDSMHYMQAILDTVSASLEVAMEHNMVKLAERYGQDYEYTDQKAIDRADKTGE